MSFYNAQTNIQLLLSFTILGLVYSQISVPLKTNRSKGIYFTVTDSTQQCETKIFLDLSSCSNLQIRNTPDIDTCFTNSRGDITQDVIFGNTLSNISYTTYTQESQNGISYYYGELCLGSAQNSTLSEFVSQKLISKQITYFNLFQSIGQNGIVGEINFGSPNYNNIKKGANFVQLKQDPFSHNQYTVQNKGLLFLGYLLEPKNVIFTLDKDIFFTQTAFVQMVEVMEKLGIPHTVEKITVFKGYRVLLPSIERLQPIEFSLTLEDNTSYNLTLQVSQYTKQLDDGQFQLTIYLTYYSKYIYLGRNVFQSHIVGFNQSNSTVQIAEKGDEDRSLRRSQNNFD